MFYLFFLSFSFHLLLKSPRVHKCLPRSVSACFLASPPTGRNGGQRAGSRGAGGPPRRSQRSRPRAAPRAPHRPGAAPGGTRTWLERRREQEAPPREVAGPGLRAGAVTRRSEEPRTSGPVGKAAGGGQGGRGLVTRGVPALHWPPPTPLGAPPLLPGPLLAPAAPQTAKGSYTGGCLEVEGAATGNFLPLTGALQSRLPSSPPPTAPITRWFSFSGQQGRRGSRRTASPGVPAPGRGSHRRLALTPESSRSDLGESVPPPGAQVKQARTLVEATVPSILR